MLRSRVSCVAFLSGIAFGASAVGSASDLAVGRYVLVSKQPAPGGRYDYVLRADLINRGATVHNARATATSRLRSVQVLDGSLTFGTVLAGRSVTSSDTFTLRARSLDARWLLHFLGHGFESPELDDFDRDDRGRGWSFQHDDRDACDDDWDDDDDDDRGHGRGGDGGRRGGDRDHGHGHGRGGSRHRILTWDIQFDQAGDTTAPTISGESPKDVFVASASPTIAAQYQDAGSGVDTTKVSLKVDGVEVASMANVTATAVSFVAGSLAEGRHEVALAVADKAGNAVSSSWSFTVDVRGPAISDESPKHSFVATTSPTIRATYQDTGSGIDVTKLRLKLDGADVTSGATVAATAVAFAAGALAEGRHDVVLELADKAGNVASSSWSFTVDISGPAVTGVAPADGEVLAADALPTLKADFADGGAGIDVAATTITLDDQDITAECTVAAAGFTRTLTTPLTEGAHRLVVTVKDQVGNTASAQSSFRTSTPPTIFGQAPMDTFVLTESQPVIRAEFADVGSGIEAAQVRISLDSVDVTASAQITASFVEYTAVEPLAEGTHSVKVVVTDRAGNSTESTWEFGAALAPEITEYSPTEALPPHSQPAITARFRDERFGIDPSKTILVLNGEDVTAQSVVTADSIHFTPAQPLAAGPYTLYLQVSNRVNASALALWGFEVEAEKSYSVVIEQPSASTVVLQPRVEVIARGESNASFATTLTLNGTPMLPLASEGDDTETRHAGTAALVEGLNTLVVEATFSDDTVRTTSIDVRYDAPPRVTLTAPLDRSVLGRANQTSPGDLTGAVERPVTVTGHVSKPVARVRINQQDARLLDGGREFRFDNYFLREGMNILTAVATDDSGQVGTAVVTVSVDQTAPILSVEAPRDQAITSNQTVDVRGVVNDAVEGFLGAPEPTVTVNGRSAAVADRYYLAAGIPLQIGENTLTVVATDQFGNARTQTLSIVRTGGGADRLSLLSGNDQKGTVVTELPQPLVVAATDAKGEPIAGVAVRFDVLRGTGTISTTPGQPTKPDGVTPARNLEVVTDASGRAQVWLTLGKQSGAGANAVRASHVDFVEDVTFVATATRGAPSKVLADTGIFQFAATGSQPLELLSVVIRDREDNPLPGVPVIFRIEAGDAAFVNADGEKSATVVLTTDKNGLTATRPTAGATPGFVRISAKALRAPGGDIHTPSDLIGEATYQLEVKEALNGPASFKGYVYTDKGQPLPGVQVSIGRTALTSTTDDTGAFALEDVPPGRVDLFVDARTTNHEGKTWPSLHFEAFVVRGHENRLPHPIHLPPLLTSEAKVVGGDEDVILRIPGVEGFQMKVKAHSVTFPDGSRQGTLVVSPVTADRLPMAPPAGGTTFGVPAWTIQPAGTRFDPPIEVQLPNSSSQPPGDNLPVVQWDHDLGQFVPMGRATVTEDGAFLITDAGSGVTKAGWGGLCVYDPNKCGQDAPPKCKGCETRDESGECPGCKYDPALDGKVTEREQFGVTIQPEMLKWAVTNGAKAFGLPLKDVRLKLVLSAGTSKKCCSAKQAETSEDTASIVLDGELNAEGLIKRLPHFEKVQIPGGPKISFGFFVKGKVFVSGGGRFGSDDCKDETIYDYVWAAGLALDVVGKATVESGSGDKAEVLADVGIAGGFNGKGNKDGWSVNVFASAFAKLELTFDNRKWTLGNQSVTFTHNLSGPGSDIGAVEAAVSN